MDLVRKNISENPFKFLPNIPGNKVPSSPKIFASKTEFFELYFPKLSDGDNPSGVNVKLFSDFGSLKISFCLLMKSKNDEKLKLRLICKC